MSDPTIIQELESIRQSGLDALAGLNSEEELQAWHGAHHFLDRGIRVVAVAEIQVHVIGAQTLQAGVDGFSDVLARQSAPVGALAGRPEYFARDHQFLARQVGDGLAHEMRSSRSIYPISCN